MKPFHKHFVAAFGLLTVLAVTPTSAFARGTLHIDIPGISIGVHDDHGYKHRKRHHRKHHRNHNRNYRHRDKRNNYYYNERRYNDQYYDNRRYNDRRYNSRRSNDNYYYGGRRNDRGYYNNNRRSQVCPIDGYSRYYDRNRSCYEHKNHFHCS